MNYGLVTTSNHQVQILPTPGTGAGIVYQSALIFDFAPSSTFTLPNAPFCKGKN